MNAIPDQTLLASVPIDWGTIYAEVNAWRGTCIHHFSTVEHAVTRTLLAMDQARPDGAKIRLRHLIGQQFQDLAEAIEPEGPFADQGKTASTALAHYRERHEVFRAQLCHGQLAVSVSRGGKWVLVLRTLSIRARQADAGLMVLEQPGAVARLGELSRDARKLAGALGQVRKSIAPPDPAK